MPEQVRVLKIKARSGGLESGDGRQKYPPSLLSEIKRAADADAGFVENVGVDLGGGDVGVTEEFLNGS